MSNEALVTMRLISSRNLDPFTKHTDADIWRALEDVELKHIATGPLGLEFVVFSNGANFSVGEVWTL